MSVLEPVRSAGSSLSSPILNLPFELTHHIIDLCRPGSFEAVALTCKQLYNVATALSRSHEDCKRRLLTSAALERHAKHKDHIILRGPYDLLWWLLRLPKDQQIDQLRYVQNVSLIPAYEHNELEDLEAVERMEIDCPSLRAAFALNAAELNITEPDTELASGDDLSDAKTPRDEYYIPVFLCMLTELRCLVLNAPIDLPRLVDQLQGRLHFQALEELHTKGAAEMDDFIGDVLKLCLLPKLKTLSFDGDSGEWPLWRRRARIDPQLLGPVRAPLRRLAVRGMAYRFEDLHHFFRKLPDLRTLIWEDDTKPQVPSTRRCRAAYIDEAMESCESSDIKGPERDAQLRAQYPELFSEIDCFERRFRTDPDFDIDCFPQPNLQPAWITEDYHNEYRFYPAIDSPPGNFDQTPTDALFKPSVLLHQIAKAYGGTLEHLAVFGPWWPSERFIQRKYKILGFQMFTKLKYLEIDINLLRPKTGESDSFPPFHKTLPPSLEVLAIACNKSLYDGSYFAHSALESLSSGLAEAKSRGRTRLRKIVVRDDQPFGFDWDQDYRFARFQTETRNEFKAVGITVEWREPKPSGQMAATMDWENPKVVDDLEFSCWTG